MSKRQEPIPNENPNLPVPASRYEINNLPNALDMDISILDKGRGSPGLRFTGRAA